MEVYGIEQEKLVPHIINILFKANLLNSGRENIAFPRGNNGILYIYLDYCKRMPIRDIEDKIYLKSMLSCFQPFSDSSALWFVTDSPISLMAWLEYSTSFSNCLANGSICTLLMRFFSTVILLVICVKS